MKHTEAKIEEEEIFCALTERTFRFTWPIGFSKDGVLKPNESLEPTDWDNLTSEIEEKTGGIFKGRLRNLKPGQYESALIITSDASNQTIIDEVSDIIRSNISGKQVKFVFYGAVNKNTNWRR